jgi:hypothetical protein
VFPATVIVAAAVSVGPAVTVRAVAVAPTVHALGVFGLLVLLDDVVEVFHCVCQHVDALKNGGGQLAFLSVVVELLAKQFFKVIKCIVHCVPPFPR